MHVLLLIKMAGTAQKSVDLFTSGFLLSVQAFAVAKSKAAAINRKASNPRTKK